jgi:hypothetical protein
MAYRDDLDAALNRVTSLERELHETRDQHADDAERIAQLERSLDLARRQMAAMQQGYAPPAQYGYTPPLPPSNATMVLVFGILSLTVCSLFGPFAWYYGSAEIRKMDFGIVDASARGSAVAGKVCGIIATCLLMFAGFFFMMMLMSMP